MCLRIFLYVCALACACACACIYLGEYICLCTKCVYVLVCACACICAYESMVEYIRLFICIRTRFCPVIQYERQSSLTKEIAP